jgi:hypothetical protein
LVALLCWIVHKIAGSDPRMATQFDIDIVLMIIPLSIGIIALIHDRIIAKQITITAAANIGSNKEDIISSASSSRVTSISSVANPSTIVHHHENKDNNDEPSMIAVA